MTKTQNLLDSKMYLKDRNALVEGGEPFVLQCHSYNVSLQAIMEDLKETINTYEFLVNNAHAVAYNFLQNIKAERSLSSTEEILQAGKDLYQQAGLGIIEFPEIASEKGVIRLPYELYAIGWLEHYGKREKNYPGVSFFARGFVEALIEIAFDLPLGSVHSEQTKCPTKGDEFVEIIYEKKEARFIPSSPGIGIVEPVKPMKQPSDTSVNYEKVRDAFLDSLLRGSENEGINDQHGNLLLRMFANYYTLNIKDFIVGIKKTLGEGGMLFARDLLREAAHYCAFHTFGNIVQSEDWKKTVLPDIKTREDWLHGMVAVVNSFGWGVVQIEELIPNEKLVLSVASDYETNSYLKMMEENPEIKEFFKDEEVGYLFKGLAATMMNLIYNSDFTEKQTLDEEFYRQMSEHKNYFQAEQVKSRLQGDDLLIVVAKKVQ